LHGATPSERTFLGVFPMLASMNFTTQILRSIRLKRRLRKISPVHYTGGLVDARN
jgi:hypothetical protein